jgi:hypothetical protein
MVRGVSVHLAGREVLPSLGVTSNLFLRYSRILARQLGTPFSDGVMMFGKMVERAGFEPASAKETRVTFRRAPLHHRPKNVLEV